MSKLPQYVAPMSVRLCPEDDQAFRALLRVTRLNQSQLLRTLLRRGVREELARRQAAAEGTMS